MRLSTILFLLGLKLRWNAWIDDEFRKQLRRLDRVVVIRTRDGRCARSYVFRHDGIKVHRGVHPDATTELVWTDAGTALTAMLSRNQLDSFSAIGRGDLSIQGNLQDALWFSDLVS